MTSTTAATSDQALLKPIADGDRAAPRTPYERHAPWLTPRLARRGADQAPASAAARRGARGRMRRRKCRVSRIARATVFPLRRIGPSRAPTFVPMPRIQSIEPRGAPAARPERASDAETRRRSLASTKARARRGSPGRLPSVPELHGKRESGWFAAAGAHISAGARVVAGTDACRVVLAQPPKLAGNTSGVEHDRQPAAYRQDICHEYLMHCFRLSA
jgi:hypothetical protein